MNETKYKKGFDLNGHQELIIACYGMMRNPVPFILKREHKRGDSILDRTMFIKRDSYQVQVRLVSEALNVVYRVLNFEINVIRKPVFKLEVKRLD